MNFYEEDKQTALEAMKTAQHIAFGPIVFQATRVLRNTGILKEIENARQTGISLDDLVIKTGYSNYAVRVLTEAGLSIGLLTFKAGKYATTKAGYYILNDASTNINMDFVHDVCYEGFFALDKSIESGKPQGLKVFGEWNTFYEALSKLPENVRKTWLDFDHFYSDNSFQTALKIVLETGAKKIIDVGGNTGKWAIACTQAAPDTEVTIVDLPGQINMAAKKIAELKLHNRVFFHEANVLDEEQQLPQNHDAVWMSQFLDCFSDVEIVSILKRCYTALNDDGFVFILEPFWDCQRFDTAAFCLQQTSLYFTAIANGNSQMYRSDVFIKCVETGGFTVEKQINDIGMGNTLLICKKKLQ